MVGACALAWVACAHDVRLRDGRYQHVELGYTIAPPQGDWTPIRVAGADLAFRGPAGATLSLLSRCDASGQEAAVAARRLVFGIRPRTLIAAEPFDVAGASGWRQRVRLGSDEAGSVVDSVTVVLGGCLYDWVLVRAGPAVGEDVLAGWVAGFRPGSPATSAEPARRPPPTADPDVPTAGQAQP